MAAFEILKSTLRTREYVQKGEGEGKSLLDAMRDGSNDGMQCFDDEIEKLVRAGTVDIETGLAASTNPGNLTLQLADLLEPQSEIPSMLSELTSNSLSEASPPVPAELELEPQR